MKVPGEVEDDSTVHPILDSKRAFILNAFLLLTVAVLYSRTSPLFKHQFVIAVTSAHGRKVGWPNT